MGTRFTRHWWKPVRTLRQKEGLSPECSPLTRDKFSPQLVLALFSRSFAELQPDWPKNTVQTGFVFYDGQSSGTKEEDQLRAFLDEGEPPLVFTLGSTAVNHPGSFYESSMLAVKKLGKRAILLGVPKKIGTVTRDILSFQYAPYSEVCPRASLIVHQGGSGTTGRALQAGRPMLFVPYGWDQPDNGVRVERLGAALMVPRAKYAPETSVAALSRLLNEPDFALNASILGKKLAEEDGLTRACDAVELLLK
jgi:rhamnosyltransferase subunit B